MNSPLSGVDSEAVSTAGTKTPCLVLLDSTGFIKKGDNFYWPGTFYCYSLFIAFFQPLYQLHSNSLSSLAPLNAITYKDL